MLQQTLELQKINGFKNVEIFKEIIYSSNNDVPLKFNELNLHICKN